MKRIVLICALCAALLALTACGGKDTAKQAVPETVKQASAETVEQAAPETVEKAKGAIDVDLTALSGTVVYSQVYDMMERPEEYMGKTIRMRGSFSYFMDPDTRQEYFAAVIADATACCAQGIEFDWQGEHSYPKDYPPLNTEVTVTGTFGTYYEGEAMFARLNDATVTW